MSPTENNFGKGHRKFLKVVRIIGTGTGNPGDC